MFIIGQYLRARSWRCGKRHFRLSSLNISNESGIHRYAKKFNDTGSVRNIKHIGRRTLRFFVVVRVSLIIPLKIFRSFKTKAILSLKY